MGLPRLLEDVVLVIFVLTVIVTDVRWRRIPNVVTYPAMLVGLALGAAEAIPGAIMDTGLLDHAAALALAFALTYPFYAGRMMKGGDAKLLMAVGALRGVRFFIGAALYGSIVGGVLALVLIAARRLDPPDTEGLTGARRVLRSQLPYGVALGIGALLALLVEP